MNSQFKANLIKVLANKKSNKGFTLIELLVVVIIVGVLAAVALPNLLGQVGKARETEAKSAVGSINRAQQGIYLEQKQFYDGTAWQEALGVKPGEEFYAYSNTTTLADSKITAAADNTAMAQFEGDAKKPGDNGTRDFASSISYNSQAGVFKSATCVAETKDDTEGTQQVTANAQILLDQLTDTVKVDPQDPVTTPTADPDLPCRQGTSKGSLIK